MHGYLERRSAAESITRIGCDGFGLGRDGSQTESKESQPVIFTGKESNGGQQQN